MSRLIRECGQSLRPSPRLHVLRCVDAQALDRIVWLVQRAARQSASGQPFADEGIRAIAVDGKTALCARGPDRTATHLFAAFDHLHGVVLGQTEVEAKTNENHRVRGTHFVKGNWPALHAQLASLPWHDIPVAAGGRHKGHGRIESGTLKLTVIDSGIAFPHVRLAQGSGLVRLLGVSAQRHASDDVRGRTQQHE